MRRYDSQVRSPAFPSLPFSSLGFLCLFVPSASPAALRRSLVALFIVYFLSFLWLSVCFIPIWFLSALLFSSQSVGSIFVARLQLRHASSPSSSPLGLSKRRRSVTLCLDIFCTPLPPLHPPTPLVLLPGTPSSFLQTPSPSISPCTPGRPSPTPSHSLSPFTKHTFFFFVHAWPSAISPRSHRASCGFSFFLLICCILFLLGHNFDDFRSLISSFAHAWCFVILTCSTSLTCSSSSSSKTSTKCLGFTCYFAWTRSFFARSVSPSSSSRIRYGMSELKEDWRKGEWKPCCLFIFSAWLLFLLSL